MKTKIFRNNNVDGFQKTEDAMNKWLESRHIDLEKVVTNSSKYGFWIILFYRNLNTEE